MFDLTSQRVLAGAAGAGAKLYVENVFSTWLYTGNGSTQTITNGIDLSGKGGLVWLKARNLSGYDNILIDTARGNVNNLVSNSTAAAFNVSSPGYITFGSSGFDLASSGNVVNDSGTNGVSWTFRKAAKFFDVVTWSGDGSSSRAISHNLGSVPGCIIVKATNVSGEWETYHRGLNGGTNPQNCKILLNSTAAQVGPTTGAWAQTAPTSTVFYVNGNANTNDTGKNYVAYLFAHDAGGFGDSGNDSVVKCGSYTGNGSTSGPTINLGWEPQWLLVKCTTNAYTWVLHDNMRGIVSNGNDATLYPNTSAAEDSGGAGFALTATGFQVQDTNARVNGNGDTYIYIAIRRGPMKTPTDATTVFHAKVARDASSTSVPSYSAPFPVDLAFSRFRIDGENNEVGSRLQGPRRMYTNTTGAEVTSTDFAFDYQAGWGNIGGASSNFISWMFRRAPGFFDVVAYTGDGSTNRQVNHNLGVTPELIIVKARSANQDWVVYSPSINIQYFLRLQSSNGQTDFGSPGPWNSTAPTSSVFTVNSGFDVNSTSVTYIAYLFASCPGVSKCFNYTGTGTSQTINCGFTSGARFVLIKRTDSTGNWLVADTARGIVSGNDPLLYLNSTAAEITTLNWLDPDSSGFIVNQEATANANVNGATYIGLAIA